jgi:plastocyanin
MKKFLILLVCLSLAAFSVACDEEETAEADEATEEQQEEVADEEDEQAHHHDESEEAEEEEAAFAVPEEGTIVVRATQMGFEPADIQAPAGETLTIVFERDIENTCMDSVVFPDLDIDEDLPMGEKVAIEITPEEGQEIGFNCRMGHGKSTITGT